MYEGKTTAELQEELATVLIEEREIHQRIRQHKEALAANELYRFSIVSELERRRQNPAAPVTPNTPPTAPPARTEKLVNALRSHARQAAYHHNIKVAICDARR